MIPAYSLDKSTSFKNVLIEGQKQEFKPHPVSYEDIAFLQYTGGTTGVSKGAVLTHKNLSANVEQAYQWVKDSVVEGKEVIITALPLYHIFSLTANFLTFFRIGAQNILIPNPRDFPGFVKTLKDINFTAITGVNTLFNALLNNKDFLKIRFQSFN